MASSVKHCTQGSRPPSMNARSVISMKRRKQVSISSLFHRLMTASPGIDK